MSLKDYKAMPVNECPNNQNRQNVYHAMKEAENSPVKTTKMELLYAEGREKEGREEENKVRANIYKYYDDKHESARKKYEDECEKVSNELDGREKKQAYNDLNNKYKAEADALDKKCMSDIKELEKCAAKAKGIKGKADNQNESVAKSR